MKTENRNGGIIVFNPSVIDGNRREQQQPLLSGISGIHIEPYPYTVYPVFHGL